MNMLPKDDIPAEYRDRSVSTPQCESFMHLHLGIDRKVTLVDPIYNVASRKIFYHVC